MTHEGAALSSGAPLGEAALIAAAQRGDDRAFSRLVGLHQQAVRAFLRRLVGDHAAADDLAQEAFVTGWSTIRRFEGRASFRSWVCGVAYKKALTSRRGQGRAMRRDAEFLAAQDRQRAAPADPAMKLALEGAMAALPADQRASVALCLAADFSHAEAADALGLPLGTVKSHVARGREKLQARLGGRDD